jgi:hypothetical protein
VVWFVMGDIELAHDDNRSPSHAARFTYIVALQLTFWWRTIYVMPTRLLTSYSSFTRRIVWMFMRCFEWQGWFGCSRWIASIRTLKFGLCVPVPHKQHRVYPWSIQHMLVVVAASRWLHRSNAMLPKGSVWSHKLR